MPIPPATIQITGTPITSQLGVGTAQGNALQISGLTLQPNAPGWTLTDWMGGPGSVSGTWIATSGAERSGGGTVKGGVAPGPQGGDGSGGGSGGGAIGLLDDSPAPATGRLSRTEWLFLILVGALLLKGK